MSQNSSEQDKIASDRRGSVIRHKWRMVVILPAWVLFGFFTSELIVAGLVWLLLALNVPLKSYNQSVVSTAFAAIVYLVTLCIVILIPMLVKKRMVTKSDVGLNRWPLWSDIFLAPAGFVVYIFLSSLLILLATNILPWFNAHEAQNTGFEHLTQHFEFGLAFFTLVLVAPFAEEVLFRGYLFGKLKRYVPIWLAVLVTSLLFGAIHGAWDLAIDTFALSIVLCYLRETTGNIWASVLLHMLKNGIAFYLLFIYPSLLTTLVR